MKRLLPIKDIFVILYVQMATPLEAISVVNEILRYRHTHIQTQILLFLLRINGQ